jgi:two-component system cell cycle response regulator
VTARVLVVDDSFGSLALLQAHLKSEYLEAISAHDGPAALTAVIENQPDLVVLDLVMEGMDGFEVCHRIKSNPATTHIPILALSGLEAPTDRAKALNAGADAYMTKPPKPLALIARVRSLIQSKRVADELRFQEGSEPTTRFENSATMLSVDISRGQLLFITDDRRALDHIRIPLAPHHQVHMDGDPEDALLVVKRAEFDAILVDLALRGADGLRLCSRLRTEEETRRTPLLAVMRDDNAVVRLRALEIGVSDFLMLPVHPGELAAIVNVQVRQRRYCNTLRRSLRSSLEQAVRDPLTGMHNRGYLDSHLGPLVSQNVARRRPVSLLIVDVDHFKKVNDTYGHDVGDEVLREVARRMTSGLRGIDLFCRFGGEEFVAAFSDTDSATAVSIAERLCGKICEEPIAITAERSSIRVTISIGVATTERTDTAETLLKRADKALYRAKNEGRNRVVGPMDTVSLGA